MARESIHIQELVELTKESFRAIRKAEQVVEGLKLQAEMYVSKIIHHCEVSGTYDALQAIDEYKAWMKSIEL